MRPWSAALIAALIALGVFTASAPASTRVACDSQVNATPQDPAPPQDTTTQATTREGCGDPGPICGAGDVACPPVAVPCSPVGEIPSGTSRVMNTCDAPCPPPLPVTDPATGIGGSSAILNGHLLSWGGDTRYYFEYGPNPTNFQNSTPLTTLPGGAQTVNAQVSNLPGGTTYFRLAVVGCGATQYGDVLSFSGPKASSDDGASADAPASAALAAPAEVTADSSVAPATVTVAHPAVDRVTRATTPKKAKKAKKARKARKARKTRRAARRH